jgi:hypothetical protein
MATDGAFTPDGTFIPMPEVPVEPYLKLWEKNLFDLLLAEGRITQQVVDQMRTWQHSGFSVDKSVRLDAGDTAAIERLTQYIVRCPFSLDRIVSLNPDGKVVYRAEKAECRPFPALGDQNLRQGVKRNFEVFDPLDFIAEITQHIPDPGAQQIRYYGWYSNSRAVGETGRRQGGNAAQRSGNSRGQRAKAANAAAAAQPPVQPVIEDHDDAYRKSCRQRHSTGSWSSTGRP